MGTNPYGGTDFTPLSSDPWDNLREIQCQLEADNPLRPGLARWLGDAIQAADGDPAKLLQQLGLKRAKGKPHAYPPEMWRWWGQRVQQEIDKGKKPEESLGIVMGQLAAVMLEPPERSTLKRWHVKWRAAWAKQLEEWARIEDQLRQEASQPRNVQRERMDALLDAWRAESAAIQREQADAMLPPEIRKQIHKMDAQLEALRKKLTGCP
ncbi:hypothetical protein THIX_20490 [Thiomonas sp. X19]|uniref:hypothetical protein n=1 Tax=Thiomonas sp. X19 TaxID=1050370 RepID=UPI000B6F1EE6|nr:hypothetical protein [Thiomonas sp. X19]SCC92440.1 hypothetical protein THIX_20490 [Thiomonas sp. X19]